MLWPAIPDWAFPFVSIIVVGGLLAALFGVSVLASTLIPDTFPTTEPAYVLEA